MITHLHIQNFKILRDNQFSFRNLNLLTGLNGMGKSTLIQALLLLRQSAKKGKIETLELEGDLCEIGTQENAFTQKVNADFIGFSFGIGQDQYKYNFKIDRQKISSSESLSSVENTINLEKISLFNTRFQYISAERIHPKKKQDYDQDTIKKNQISKIKGRCEYAVHFLGQKIKDFASISLDTLQHPKTKSKNLIEQVNAWVGEISPSIQVDANVNDKERSVTLLYKYEMNDGYTDEIKPENTGFGISYALPIIIALLSAQAGDLLIIENPESHLHPKGQSKLAELMCLAAQNGVQIFCETHSDHIVNGVRVGIIKNKKENVAENVKIFYFTKNNDATSQVFDIPITEGARLKVKELRKKDITGFFDQIDTDLSIILANGNTI